MVYEFAVEPTLLNTWDQFRYLVEKFDVSQGRLISRFPKKWKKMVYESLNNCKEIERARIEEGLRRIDHRLLNTIRSYNCEGPTWLENAEASYAQKPFRAILAGENPRHHAGVIDGRILDEATALWAIPDPPRIPRLAASIAAAVGPFIKMGDVLILIDPNVRPHERRYANSLAALFEIARRADGSFPERMELHVKYSPDVPGAPTIEWLTEKCEKFLPAVVPAGARLTVRILKQRQGGKELHERYLLTDIGCIKVGPGIDEGEAGEEFELVRLSQDLYRGVWTDYASAQPSYDCIKDIPIVRKAGQNR
jgi:hypothetical protein